MVEGCAGLGALVQAAYCEQVYPDFPISNLFVDLRFTFLLMGPQSGLGVAKAGSPQEQCCGVVTCTGPQHRDMSQLYLKARKSRVPETPFDSLSSSAPPTKKTEKQKQWKYSWTCKGNPSSPISISKLLIFAISAQALLALAHHLQGF